MPADPTSTDPATLLVEAAIFEREAAALAPVLARVWPRAVARVLSLAARAGALNRQAVALNAALAHAGIERRVLLVVPGLPLSVAAPLWRAVLGADGSQESAT